MPSDRLPMFVILRPITDACAVGADTADPAGAVVGTTTANRAARSAAHSASTPTRFGVSRSAGDEWVDAIVTSEYGVAERPGWAAATNVIGRCMCFPTYTLARNTLATTLEERGYLVSNLSMIFPCIAKGIDAILHFFDEKSILF